MTDISADNASRIAEGLYSHNAAYYPNTLEAFATEGHDVIYALRAHIDAQDAKIKTLVEALQGVSQFFAMPHENATDRFDRLAEQYLRETGKWAPGKSVPDAYNDSTDCETRRKDYDEWVQSKVDTSRTAIAAAKETT